jgi:LysR family transcriptional regulator, hydrogen peroxide-inducible genes activator
MRPTFRQLQYLVAVADCGRFGEAASRLNVTQPSLSAQIAEMEGYLGATLLERGRHGATLTPVGAEMVRRARFILRDLDDLKAAVRRAAGELAGRIQLGVLPSVGPYLLPEAVKRLHALFPDLRLALREERTIDLDAHLQDGRLDVVISTLADHPNAVGIPLFEEELWICVAADDPLADEAGPIRLARLKGRELLSLSHGHGLSQITKEIAHRAGAHVSTEYEGTSLDAIRQMAVMGAGAAVLPSLYVAAEAQFDKAIRLRRIDHASARREISLLWRPSSPLADQYGQLSEVLAACGKSILAQLRIPGSR